MRGKYKRKKARSSERAESSAASYSPKRLKNFLKSAQADFFKTYRLAGSSASPAGRKLSRRQLKQLRRQVQRKPVQRLDAAERQRERRRELERRLAHSATRELLKAFPAGSLSEAAALDELEQRARLQHALKAGDREKVTEAPTTQDVVEAAEAVQSPEELIRGGSRKVLKDTEEDDSEAAAKKAKAEDDFLLPPVE